MTDYRAKALEHYGHECQNCGSTDGLEVHHKNMVRCYNNIENLCVLCSDCHDTVHYGWPDRDSFLWELKKKTRINLPEPVYIEAVSQAELQDVTPGIIVQQWMENSDELEQLKQQ